MTEQDLILAVLEASQRREEKTGLTLNEIIEETGKGKYYVRKRLKALNDQGKLTVERVYRENICGVMSPSWGYALKKEE